jgi:serine/threonine-protein kinase
MDNTPFPRVTEHAPTTFGSPADALRDEEVARTRTFIQLAWAAAVGALLALVVLPGDRRIAIALAIGTAIAIVGSFGVYVRLRTPSKFEPKHLNILAFVTVIVTQIGILYVGTFSAASIIVALGVYFFCRTESFLSAVGVYIVAAGSHGLLSTLVVFHVLPDTGFYRVGDSCPFGAQIVALLSIQQMYAMCFFLARGTRRTSITALEKLQRATRLAAQRDLQVAELRRDLDKALQIGGPGRFTGHVVGSWELGPVLGRGAMGEVYEAKHASTGAEGAVKLLRRELLGDSQHVERFFREVRTAGSIDSPHVVQVLDSSAPTDQLPFLAMERLRGQTLGEILRAGGLTGASLAQLVSQVGSALERAREAGVVHRDLKPHNIFRTEDGVWKVVDFGVAVHADNSGTLTQGGVIGTPAYMAPEQAKGELVDHRADTYALGAVIYRCLTGRVPFAAKDTPALLYAVVHLMPLRPSALGAVSPHVEAFLAVAMAKPREDRFQSAGQLAAAYSAAHRNALPQDLLDRATRLLREHAWIEPDREPPRRPSKQLIS